jgi:hypothetical protein
MRASKAYTLSQSRVADQLRQTECQILSGEHFAPNVQSSIKAPIPTGGVWDEQLNERFQNWRMTTFL